MNTSTHNPKIDKNHDILVKTFFYKIKYQTLMKDYQLFFNFL
jgi:hypothetical protein